MHTTILLIRHAESVGNVTGKISGITEFDLTKKGKQQALMLKDRLKTFPIHRIYVSPLRRTYQTILPTAQTFQKEVVVVDDLVEMNFGVIDGLTMDEVKEQHQKAFEFFSKHSYFKDIPNQETVEDSSKRLKHCLTSLAKQNINHVVAVVSHGTVITNFLIELLQIGFESYQVAPYQNNTAITILNYDPILDKFSALKIADDSHLSSHL